MNARVLYSTALCLYLQNFSIYFFFNRCTQGFCRGNCESWEWNSCCTHTFPHTTYLRGPEQPTAIPYSGLRCSCHLESETFSLPPFSLDFGFFSCQDDSWNSPPQQSQSLPLWVCSALGAHLWPGGLSCPCDWLTGGWRGWAGCRMKVGRGDSAKASWIWAAGKKREQLSWEWGGNIMSRKHKEGILRFGRFRTIWERNTKAWPCPTSTSLDVGVLWVTLKYENHWLMALLGTGERTIRPRVPSDSHSPEAPRKVPNSPRGGLGVVLVWGKPNQEQTEITSNDFKQGRAQLPGTQAAYPAGSHWTRTRLIWWKTRAKENASFRRPVNFWQLLPVLPSTNPVIQYILESNPIGLVENLGEE